MKTKVVGLSLPRVDAWDKVTGRAKYPGDFSMPGMLYGKVVWSEQPHARVRRIDTSQAETYPGVVKVITYRDVPVNEYGISIMDQPVLVAKGDKVRWVGDRIAIVVAETEQAAREACRLVQVEYEPLPVVTDPREAMKPGSPLVHEERASSIPSTFVLASSQRRACSAFWWISTSAPEQARNSLRTAPFPTPFTCSTSWTAPFTWARQRPCATGRRTIMEIRAEWVSHPLPPSWPSRWHGEGTR